MSSLVEELPLGKSGDDYVSRDYPPLLRAQRLSYAMAVIMPNARQVGLHPRNLSYTLILRQVDSTILRVLSILVCHPHSNVCNVFLLS